MVVSRAFAVPSDQRLEEVRGALPGVNCGACGYSGCDAYASAILQGAPLNLCAAGGPNTAKSLSEIMGVEAGELEQKVAVVHCRGFCNATAVKYDFHGIQSCAAANRFYNGSKVCTHSCLGLGDCQKVCPNGAISFRDQLSFVDMSKCIGCGLCVKACPNGILELHSRSQITHIRCRSTEMGRVTKAVCSNGCLGCGICAKKCPKEAITIENNLAHIDPAKCVNCGVCAKSCPTGAIDCCKSTEAAIRPKPLPVLPKKDTAAPVPTPEKAAESSNTSSEEVLTQA